MASKLKKVASKIKKTYQKHIMKKYFCHFATLATFKKSGVKTEKKSGDLLINKQNTKKIPVNY